MDGTFVNEYKSMTHASKITGVKLACISKTAMGNQRQAGGYIWRKI